MILFGILLHYIIINNNNNNNSGAFILQANYTDRVAATFQQIYY
jgi:hypothetical protein